MRAMEQPVVSQRPEMAGSEIDQHRTQANANEGQRDPQIRSLITPGLVSVPPLPAWLRKLFRHSATPAARGISRP